MTALYLSIRNDLLTKISDGTFADGDVIPSEIELASAYNVSRSTVRKALSMLEQEGYISRRRRRGTVVMSSRIDSSSDGDAGVTDARNADDAGVAAARNADGAGAVGDAASAVHDTLDAEHFTGGVWNAFETMSLAPGSSLRTMEILAKEDVASEDIAKELNIKPGVAVYKIIRIRYLNDQPNQLVEGYVPCALFEGFIEGVDFSKTRLYERMKELGRAVKTVHRSLHVTKADPPTASILDVMVGDPLFLIYTHGCGADGTVYEYSIDIYRGESTSFNFTIRDVEL